MSIRRYCDACGQEIEKSYAGHPGVLAGTHTFRPNRTVVKVHVTVTARINEDGNDDDLCRDCVIDAVKSLDTRPQAWVEDPVPLAVKADQ